MPHDTRWLRNSQTLAEIIFQCVNIDFGDRCWTQTLEINVLLTNVGDKCRRQILETNLEVKCWRWTLETNVGDKYWRQLLKTNVGKKCWRQPLEANVLVTNVGHKC